MDIRLKPYDAVMAYQSELVAVELKMWDHKKKTDVIKQLRPNQVQWLSEVVDWWWHSVIIYYNRYYNKYWVLQYKKQKELIVHTHIEEDWF